MESGRICGWKIEIYVTILKGIFIKWDIIVLCHQKKCLECIKLLHVYVGNVNNKRRNFTMLNTMQKKLENFGLN